MLIEELRSAPKAEKEGFVPPKMASVAILGVLAAVGALVWDTVTATPASFAVVQQQTTEIRATVLEMKSVLAGINDRLESNAKNTSDLQSQLASVKTKVEANESRLDRMEDEARGR